MTNNSDTSKAIKVICIGGSPSTGSTLLADLIDSIPGVLCGPELNIFCIDKAFEYSEKFKLDAIKSKPFFVDSPYVRKSKFLNSRHLERIGLDSDNWKILLDQSNTINEFVNLLAKHFAKYRHRKIKVFVEKTPNNVGYINQFCQYFPNGLFVHIVRDGRAVVSSLLRRGYSLYEAAYIWLIQTYKGTNAAACNKNAIEVKYEDLVASPFDVVAEIVTSVGLDISPAEIQHRFQENNYRCQIPRVTSWRVPNYQPQVFNNLSYENQLSKTELAFLESLVLVPLAPNETAINLGFAELLRKYKYPVKFAFQKRKVNIAVLRKEINNYWKQSQNIDLSKNFILAIKPELCQLDFQAIQELILSEMVHPLALIMTSIKGKDIPISWQKTVLKQIDKSKK